MCVCVFELCAFSVLGHLFLSLGVGVSVLGRLPVDILMNSNAVADHEVDILSSVRDRVVSGQIDIPTRRTIKRNADYIDRCRMWSDRHLMQYGRT